MWSNGILGKDKKVETKPLMILFILRCRKDVGERLEGDKGKEIVARM